MQRILLFSLLGVIFLAGISCNLLTAEESELDYPATYPIIDFSDLQQMNEEYQSANENNLCSTLNKYGFTGYSELFFEEGENPCDRSNREVVRIEMTQPDTLLQATKRTLFKNTTYTGVYDTSALKLKEISPQPGCVNCGRPDEYSANIEWKITFENQVVDSIEIPGTEIVVFLDAYGVNRIWGNWYPDIKIPDFINYGYMDAKYILENWEIDMRAYTGNPEVYTVEAEDLQKQPQKVLLPFENEDQNHLEIRYCWAVPIDYKGDGFEGWWAYVDIEEGLLIQIKSR